MDHTTYVPTVTWLTMWVALYLPDPMECAFPYGHAVFFFAVCQQLAPAASWPATILFALGTCLYSVASQSLWMHGPAAFWLCSALYFMTRPDSDHDRWRLAAGLALGLAVLTRPTTAFFAVATWVALLVQRQWRGVLWLTLGGVIPAIVLFHYNWVNFGSVFLGGYEVDSRAESPPFWLSLSGLLIAPSRGVLVYSPALLLALPGAWMIFRSGNRLWPSSRGILLAWLAASAATLLFFARWHDWRGGWCYGPRFLCETMPILCLLFAMAFTRLRSQWQRQSAVALVVLSVSVHLVGIFGYGAYEAWQLRHNLPDQGRCLFALKDTQIEAHARGLIHQLTGIGKDVR